MADVAHHTTDPLGVCRANANQALATVVAAQVFEHAGRIELVLAMLGEAGPNERAIATDGVVALLTRVAAGAIEPVAPTGCAQAAAGHAGAGADVGA